ncbi:DNA primase [Candidatus Woesearchaeota archaeon]|nr:DNA primase [Candidatus Woesearchaeota archaeon]
MAKISQVSSKYIVHASIDIDGVVDRPDVIGAIFGQTEGLLGSDLELRELQRSGRIGRIEVNTETRAGKTTGMLVIPSSLDKAETAIIAAAMEIIQRIGPCNAKIRVQKIEDVRISKRSFVVERAKELLHTLADEVLPDSAELAEEVAHSVRVMEITEYGKERLPAGPGIEEAEEIIVVEGRADVVTMLKHGFKNIVAMNGSSVPQTIIDLCRKKTVTAFVDGDRGGDLNIQELLQVSEIDYITKAPDGKEVEELTKKEIHKALRSRMTAEQARLEFTGKKPLPRPSMSPQPKPQYGVVEQSQAPRPPMMARSALPPMVARSGIAPMQRPLQARPPMRTMATRSPSIGDDERKAFKVMLEGMIGTRGAYILDQKLNILGKVPTSELVPTVKSLTTGVYAIVMDGSVDKELVPVAERINVAYIVAMDSTVKDARLTILTPDNLQ